MFRYILVAIALICAFTVQGQDSSATMQPLKKDTSKNEWKFLFALDARTSWVLGERTGLGGLKIGASVNKKHNFGIGIYFLKNQIVRGGVHLAPDEFPTATDTTSYNFSYSSLFYEPIWYRGRRLSLSTPVHFGNATVTASYQERDTNAVVWTQYFSDQVPMVEFSAVSNYKILRWFAIGAGAGYRALITKDKGAKQALNGPVLIFQVKVMFGVLYKLAFKKPIDDGWEKAKD